MKERFVFLHLSGPRRGEADAFERLPAMIGSEPGVDVVVPGVAPRHALLLRQDGSIVLQDGGSGQETYLAGEAVREAVLRDGDVLELGLGGPRLRFRHEGAPHALRSTGWIRIRTERGRPSLGFRLALAALLVAGAGILAWTYHVQRQVARLQQALRHAEEERHRFQERIEEERQRAEVDRRSLESRIEESRAREEELSGKLADSAANGEVRKLNEELKGARERLAALEGERVVAERIIREYGGGVCLIQGSYAFYDSSGRPLRQRVDEEGQPVRENDGSLALSVDSTGPIYTADYFGTGFLVDPRGLILTNRHISEPWGKDQTAKGLAREGFKTQFVVFRAFFPRITDAFKLELHRRSETVDLALLRTDLKGRKVPVLPLDLTERGAVAGQPVVVVGYPTGLEAILAKADGVVVQDILAAHGTSSERVTDALSRKGLIRPSTTQGHIGDVTKTDVVFDAPTTLGGSGGPVFNKSGQVIAVEYAVLPKFGGNAFGLPIRHALDLLKEPAPRKQPAPQKQPALQREPKKR